MFQTHEEDEKLLSGLQHNEDKNSINSEESDDDDDEYLDACNLCGIILITLMKIWMITSQITYGVKIVLYISTMSSSETDMIIVTIDICIVNCEFWDTCDQISQNVSNHGNDKPLSLSLSIYILKRWYNETLLKSAYKSDF